MNTYLRSKFEDTRRKAIKFGAHGTTVKAFKPERSNKELRERIAADAYDS